MVFMTHSQHEKTPSPPIPRSHDPPRQTAKPKKSAPPRVSVFRSGRSRAAGERCGKARAVESVDLLELPRLWRRFRRPEVIDRLMPRFLRSSMPTPLV